MRRMESAYRVQEHKPEAHSIGTCGARCPNAMQVFTVGAEGNGKPKLIWISPKPVLSQLREP